MRTINRILLSEITPRIPKFVYVLFLMFSVVGFEALSPWPFKFLIDNVLGEEKIDPHSFFGIAFSPFKTTESLAFFVIFIFFLSNFLLSLFEYLRSIELKRVIRELVYDFSKNAFDNLERFAIGFYRKQEIGDYIYRLSYDVSAIGDLIEFGVLPIITSGVFIVVTTTILFFIDVKLTFLALAFLPFMTLGLYLINKKIVVASRRSENWRSAVFSFVEQALSQLKIIQAYSREKEELKTFDEKVQTSLRTELKVNQLDFLLSLLVGVVIAVSYSVIIALGVKDVLDGILSTGLLIVFVFYLDNLTFPILEVIYAVATYQQSYVKISRLEDFFRKKSQLKDVGHIEEMKNTTIKFENVYLRGEEERKILEDVSFTIPEGKMTVIVGTSGSGKTSLISLVPRLINEPSSGKILIGKHNLNDYTIKTLRDNTAYVPQETILFNRTIRDIILFGKPDATEEEITHAVKLAVAEDIIQGHPHGYNFRIGEEGNYLSGGQRQRLMLARAYLKNAKITVLDEVFSSQDVKTRIEMVENLLKFSKGRTMVVVSNIPEIIKGGDQVVILNKGRIVGVGTHESLLKTSKFYNLLLGEE